MQQLFVVRLLLLIAIALGAAGNLAATAQVSFTPDAFTGVVNNPTSLQFGPDGRMYVSEKDGTLFAFTLQRNAAADYSIVATEQVNIVANLPNHNDDGSSCTTSACNARQVTGVLATGTAVNPVIYVSSSDPRIGAGGGGSDLGLDTNSGIISRLTCVGGVVLGICQSWDLVHMVRGLPRSEENHASNGMQIDVATNTLYLAQGGHTNAGAPSNNFAFTTEYAYSGAILSIDLDAIVALGVKTDSEGQDYYYDLPTLDDPDRANTSAVDGYTEASDPFGGNDGKNQAKIDVSGPVQIHASGFRNLYDIVVTVQGRMYGVDNGANGQWGGHPAGEADYPSEATVGVCTNEYLVGEPGSTGTGPGGDPQVNNKNGLHYIRELQPGDDNYAQAGEIYYGGHPSPIRGNPSGAGLYYNGTWLTGVGLPADWPPVPTDKANPAECDFRNSGETDNSIANFGPSTNGITEYTASNFGGALQGDLLAAGYSGSGPIYRIELNAAGDVATNCPVNPSTNCNVALLSGFGSQPLDVVAQGDDDIFPGTIWAVTYGADDLVVFEPSDYAGGSGGICVGSDDDTIDEDGDSYSNADEIDNGTNPCSAGSIPNDFDGSFAGDGFKDSNLNDPDDDDDTVLDIDDPFAIDPNNGFATSLPIQYELFNDTPGVTVSFFGLGFTGLMTNGTIAYLDQFIPPEDAGGVVAGGTAGLLTYETTDGDTYQSNNTQDNGFQFGVNVDASTPAFTLHAQINGPFFDGLPPSNYQAQGIQIGTGDMDNYLKLVLSASSGFEVASEVDGIATSTIYDPFGGAQLTASVIGLFLAVDPAAGTVTSSVSLDGALKTMLATVNLTDKLLEVVQGNHEVSPGVPSALAVGTIATSFSGQPSFSATWDFFRISLDPSLGDWQFIADYDEVRHEGAFVAASDKFFLIGGRETQTVEIYDPATGLWADGATLPSGPGWPDKLHHFQAVALDGLIYVVGALTGNCCQEPPADRVYLYDPVADRWMQGPEIPVARRRGGGGSVVYDNKIYLISGNTNGHFGPVSPFVDVFDPTTGVWSALQNLPNARDHFFAVVANDKIYVVAGRDSNARPAGEGGDGNIFDDTIAQVDVFDIGSQNWTTLPSGSDIPTSRAAPATVLLGSEIVVAGGEDNTAARDVTEAFDLASETWRTLDPMLAPRHATQGVVSNGGLYIAAGSPQKGGPGGGSPDLEAFYFFGETMPNGTPLSPASLSVPTTLDFGQVLVNDSDAKPIVITNAGIDQAILVESVSLVGSNAFTLLSPLGGPVVVPPGGSLTFDIVFDPTAAQVENANFEVTHSGGAVEIVAVSGEGIGAVSFALRINSGGPAYVDSNLDSWVADEQFIGGIGYSNGSLADGDVSGTIDDTIYLTERNSGSSLAPFAYAISVPAPGLYAVDLHFAEIYHGATGGGSGGTGKRVFSVSVEGGSQLINYDLNAEAAPQTAIVKSYVVNVNDGKLNIDLTASVDRPKLSGVGVFGHTSNAAPVVDAIPTQMSIEGDDVAQLGLFVTATDPDTGPQNLEYTATDLPPGLQLEPTNGQFSGVIALGAGFASPFSVTVDVSDGEDVTTVNFDWTVAPASTFDQSVIEGWNLLGLPRLVPDNDVATVFPSATQGTLYGFDASSGYQIVANMDVSSGYWLKFGTADVQSIQGDVVPGVVFDLPGAGWHLVAGPSCSMPVASIIDPSGIMEPNSLYSYGVSGYTTESSVEQGKGYWIQANDAGQLTLNCSPAAASISASTTKAAFGRIESVDAASDFRALVVGDAAGAERRLLFGSVLKGTVSPAAYNLPPIPPTGAFDVRFKDGGRMVEADEATIRVQSAHFPLTVSLIRAPAGEDPTVLLDELVGGRVTATHHLVPGTLVSVGNESVTALALRKIDGASLVAKIPSLFAIRGSYPNPSSGLVTLMVDLPEDAEIGVQLIDALGRIVQRIPDVTLAAGSGRPIQIRTSSSLASGTYFYRLRARMTTGTLVHTGRIMLMR